MQTPPAPALRPFLRVIATSVLGGVLLACVGAPSESTAPDAQYARKPPAAPTLTATPASITRATSATFSFYSSRANSYVCARDGAPASLCTSPVSYDAGLDDGPHTFAVKARNNRGDESVATTYAWTVDTQSPSAPPSATVTGATATTLALSWSSAQDTGSGVAGYNVYVDGALDSTSVSSPVVIDGLACARSYALGVEAVDRAGNVSSRTVMSASTSACSPMATPSVPTGLTVTASDGRVTLSWNPSLAGDQVDVYQVYRNDQNLDLNVAGTSYVDTAVVNGTTYTYRISAHNVVGYGDWTDPAIPATPTGAPPLPTADRALGIFRYGSSTFGTNADQYGVCITGETQNPDAVNLPCKALQYVAASDIPNAPWIFWMPWATANANGWFLHDSSGNVIVDPNYGAYLGNIGIPAFQQEWIKNVKAWLQAHPGTDGIFIDNVLREIRLLTGGPYPAEYPTQQAWDDVMVQFISAVGPALRSAGYYVMANDQGWWGDPAGACNSGQCTREWWPRISPYVDAHTFEGWMVTSWDHLRLAGTDHWEKFWYEHASLVEFAQSLGDDIVVLDYGLFADKNRMTYQRVSFLLFWDGNPGRWSSFWVTDQNDPWDPAWTADVGAPLAPRVALGNGMYTREYSKAKVYINPTGATQTADGLSFGSSSARIVLR